VSFDYVAAGATVLVGLLSGATGGVVAARAIGQRTREGERRYQAICAVRALVTEYRGLLEFHRNRLYEEQRGFPLEYASLQSQEELAIGVLRELPHRETDRLDMVMRYILKEPGYVDRHGLLGSLLTSQNDADQKEHHDRAIAVFDRMIGMVKP
jgi:hypothetical protein